MSPLIKTLQLIYGTPGERSNLDAVSTEGFLTTALFTAQFLEQQISEERGEAA